jgi:RNA polymerase sigma factor (sigma-70 family)
MESNLTESAADARAAGRPRTGHQRVPGDPPAGRFQEDRPATPAPQADTAERAVTELYAAHALGMIRLAHIMLGDQQSAEDVVQEAFCGLYRRWSGLSDPGSAVHYVRSAVLNGCRSVLRRRISSKASRNLLGEQPVVISAESAVLTGEERRAVMAALRRLPSRQREALVLRFYLDLSGSKLAIALRGGGGPGPAIQVVTLATGAERAWTWPGGGPITNNAGGNGSVLSWAADDRTLAFQQWAGNSIDVRILDTAAPGDSLPSNSRLVLQWKGEQESLRFVHGKAVNAIEGFSAIITPDGTKIVCATVSETKRPLTSDLAFTEFSVRTGRAVRVLGNWPLKGMYPGQTQDVLWTNRSGSTLIVVAHKPGKPSVMPHSTSVAGYSIEISALTGNRFVPIPGAPTPNSPYPWPSW